MKLFDSSKYELVGYDDGDASPYKGWVLRERSFDASFTPQLVIINKCKYIDNGVVYYLNDNGKCKIKNYNHRIGQFNYNYNQLSI